jgi:hypothetical protein
MWLILQVSALEYFLVKSFATPMSVVLPPMLGYSFEFLECKMLQDVKPNS